MPSIRPSRRQLIGVAAAAAGAVVLADIVFRPKTKPAAESVATTTDTQVAEGLARVDFCRSPSGTLSRCVISVERPGLYCAIIDAVPPGRKANEMRGERLERILFEAKAGSLVTKVDFPSLDLAGKVVCVHLSTEVSPGSYVGCFIKEPEGAFVPEKTLPPRPQQKGPIPPSVHGPRL